jgi:hypothetical protein
VQYVTLPEAVSMLLFAVADLENKTDHLKYFTRSQSELNGLMNFLNQVAFCAGNAFLM